MKYIKHPLENLSQAELEMVAAYDHPFSAENAENILVCFQDKVRESKPKKRISKRLAIALIAVVVVAFSGFANFDRIQLLWDNYFGAGANVGQYAKIIDKSVTDQGIRMDVVTALNDSDSTYLFIDLTDETGSRLSDDLFLDEWSLFANTDAWEGTYSIEKHDGSGKTATLVINGFGVNPGKKTSFSVNSFFTDKVEMDFTDDTINLEQIHLENKGQFVEYDSSVSGGGLGISQEASSVNLELDDIHSVLENGDLQVAIPGYDKGFISNIGYKDGFLHIQLNPDNERGNETIYLSLVNKDTEEEMQPYYSINYGEFKMKDSVYSAGDYEEFVFKIDRGELEDYALHVFGFYYSNVVTGSWEVSFEIPKRMTTVEITSNETITIGEKECTIRKLEISPLSILLTLNSSVRGGTVSTALIYNDGSRVSLDSHAQRLLGSDRDMYLKIVGPIMDFENLAAVEINGIEFKLPDK